MFEQSRGLDKGLNVTINKILKPLSKLTRQHIYWELVAIKSKSLISLDTWIDLFPFLENIDWRNFFVLPNRVKSEPYLQTFRYKILNRTLNSRFNPYNWKLRESPIYIYCNDKHIDTLENHLIMCHCSIKFCNRLKVWLNENMDLTAEFTVCKIRLGIPFNNEPVFLILNFLTLFEKWYINKIKSHNQIIFFSDFLEKLASKVIIFQDLYRLKKQSIRFAEDFTKSPGRVIKLTKGISEIYMNLNMVFFCRNMRNMNLSVTLMYYKVVNCNLMCLF